MRGFDLSDTRLFKAGILGVALLALGACSSIRESRGFVNDPLLVRSVQPGIDNRRSVEGTLGRPTFESQFGEPTWYYISSVTGRRPFVRPRIRDHSVLAVQFDEAGNVASVRNQGIDEVVYLQPDGARTPTLGRERGFLEDLFGNIGQVGGVGPGGPGGPGGP
jgi:outer membrane protein assembly factor BamE (lipoprotein component of BamABCDE complex)